MGKIRSEEYTLEFNNVIKYMSTTLYNEFPTDVITLEYLILSILDNKDCHANIILDNCLMSENIDELRKIYISVLEKHMKPQLKGNEAMFNDDLTRAISAAKKEAVKFNVALIGTEHILLAILNKDNCFSETNVFDKFRLEYDFIANKMQTEKKVEKKQAKRKSKLQAKNTNNNEKYNEIPLKSQVNTKMVSKTSSNSYIEQYTTSLNKLAAEGKIDDIIGRDREINEILMVLSRRKKNNVVLVGSGGAGKTAIVYGIANMIENGDVPEMLEDKEIVMLNPMEMVSGTHFRGMFEERVNGLFNELKKDNKYILFIDDIHTVLKGGTKEKDTDISGMIGEALSEGTIKIIGATTYKDYRNSIESNSSIARKFQKVVIEPTSKKETIEILNKNKKYYEEYHNVTYTDKSIEKAVELADRYITDRTLPDSAFDIIDLCGANASLSKKEPIEIQCLKKRVREIEFERDVALNNGDFEKIDSLTSEENLLNSDIADYKRSCRKDDETTKTEIDEINVASIVSEITNIPVSKLSSSEKSKISCIDKVLKENIIGQDEAIDEICKIIKRNKVGLGNSKTSSGVFLLCGPSGSGKSLTAKKIAEQIFGTEKSLIRIDMSEYSEKNSVSKLYGSAPGYIGYDEGGVLTNAIKEKPYSVVLLDEIEKADESIYNVFLQVFDEGRLTESNGNLVDCRNCIFIMTSNIGARKASELGNGAGFVNNKDSNKKSIIEKELRRKFTPEFLNRINKIVYFNNLTNDNLKNIVKLEINKFVSRLKDIEYNIEYSDDVVNYIHAEAIKEKEFGARPINRIIQTNIEDKVTELMLGHDYEPNYVFHAFCDNGEIVIE